MERSCEKVSVSFMEFYEGQDFLTFDLIYNGYVFIVVLEAVDPFVNNREDFHRKSI